MRATALEWRGLYASALYTYSDGGLRVLTCMEGEKLALDDHENGVDGFVGPCELVIAVGTK